MFQRIFVALWLLFSLPNFAQAQAQENVWLQIEAQPSLLEAEARARAYSDELDFVNAYSLGAGWYAIALGPYARPEAEQLRRQLLNSGSIPRDSFVSIGTQYRQQIWPIGGALTAPAVQPEPVETPAPAPEEVVVEVAEAVEQPDETPREARASEARLTRDEKKDLQIALKWAGFYTSTIDGSFGRGTRRSMQDWQSANGYDATGILTTKQRADLLGQYNAVLDGLDLALVSNRDAGIELQIPLGVVQFAKNDAPLVHYDANDGSVTKVLLISQEGDDFTLRALYEALQSLEIIPQDGPREVGTRAFEIQGSDNDRVTYATASLRNGEIKGFVLVWPTGDEDRRTRLLEEMQKSFSELEGTLNPEMSDADIEEIDQVFGLDIHTPAFSHAGIYVSQSGLVLTQSVGLESCERITLEGDTKADIAATDVASGLALIKPQDAITPIGVATFAQEPAGLRQDIVFAGYPYNGRLGVPSAALGKIEELRDLTGDDLRMRLSAKVENGDIGGPVLTMTGQVVGALSHQGVDRILPEGVAIAVKAATLTAFLDQSSVNYDTAPSGAEIDPLYVTQTARDITALVNCWN